MKRILFLAGAGIALTASPLLAQDPQEDGEEVDLATDGEIGGEETFEFKTVEEEEAEALEQELLDAFAIQSELFQPDPLNEEQEARLPIARELALKMLPEGSFGPMIEESFASMIDGIATLVTEDKRSIIHQRTGVSTDDLDELEDEAVEEALDLLDPDFAERTQAATAAIIGIFAQVFDAMEPSYRDALAHALAVRFEKADIDGLLTFSETDLGAKFLRQSFTIHYDPQMTRAIDAMGPAMVQILPGMIEQMEELEAQFSPARNFAELSSAERARLSELLDTGEAELDALAPVVEEEAEETGEDLT